jgi:hypothetical protein
MILALDSNDIEQLVETAAQEQSPTENARLFHALRSVELFFPIKLTRHEGREVKATPLLRLPDGTHAMMVYTSKSHSELPDKYAGANFENALAAALKMPELDWVILSNRASQRVAISKEQIPAILDDLRSGRPDTSNTNAAPGTDPAAKTIEDLITRTVQTKSEELLSPLGSALRDRELFMELADGQSEDGQPIMKTFQIEQLSHVIRAYTTRMRPGKRYGGIRWEALKDMIRTVPEISGVKIVNDADDWELLDRESLGFGSSNEPSGSER